MPAALDLCRSDCQKLTRLFHPTVGGLLLDPDFAARASARSESCGHTDTARTLCGQAAVMTLMIALSREMEDGDAGRLLAEGGPAAVAAAAAPLLGADPVIWEVISSCHRPLPDTHLAEIAEQMRRSPEADLIGAVYEETVSQADRRQLGQFWTPAPIADLMAAWAVQRPSDRVLDPAAGAGALVLPALARLRTLGACDEAIAGQLFTNDVDAVVRSILLANLRGQSPLPHPGVVLADALTSRQGETFDAIICNPPYSRHHHLEASYKKLVCGRLSQALGVRPHGLMSLFGYFFLWALSALSGHGRMAFITPAELLDASNAKTIKAHLLSSVNLRAVIFFGDGIAAFPGVDTSGIITLVEGGPCDGTDIAFIELSQWPGSGPLLDALESPQSALHSWGEVRVRSRSELAITGKWVVPAASAATAIIGARPLGELGRVTRGIATGNNAFFTLTETERLESGIEDQFLRPVLIGPRDWRALCADQAAHDALRDAGRKAWVLHCPLSPAEMEGTRALDYIRAGEASGVCEGKLISVRAVWYQLDRREPADALYTYFSRGWPRFIRNDIGALNLNGLHSVYFPEEIRDDSDLREAFMAILNSGLILSNLRSVGRSYGGGTVKVEPSELASLPVLDPRLMSADEVSALAELFRSGEHLAPVEFDAVRDRIDAVLLARPVKASPASSSGPDPSGQMVREILPVA